MIVTIRSVQKKKSKPKMSADGARLYPNHNLKFFNAYDSISVFDVRDNDFSKIS